jgi:hypothetical protein
MALFRRQADKMEKNRELAALIIKEFFSRSDDLTLSIPLKKNSILQIILSRRAELEAGIKELSIQ